MGLLCRMLARQTRLFTESGNGSLRWACVEASRSEICDGILTFKGAPAATSARISTHWCSAPTNSEVANKQFPAVPTMNTQVGSNGFVNPCTSQLGRTRQQAVVHAFQQLPLPAPHGEAAVTRLRTCGKGNRWSVRRPEAEDLSIEPASSEDWWTSHPHTPFEVPRATVTQASPVIGVVKSGRAADEAWTACSGVKDAEAALA